MASPVASPRSVAALIDATTKAQLSASDPNASAWVNANAGTGKTHVLTERVIRLMLNGTRPEKILCLTFTKAAAAEMSRRVFDRLGKWVCLDEITLRKELKQLNSKDATADQVAAARTLFTQAIETPGGLKVQTIHAFCERLLQRFPLEAGIPPGFKVLDDSKGREIIADAIDRTLKDATANAQSAGGKALQSVVRFATDHAFDTLLTKALHATAKRRTLAPLEPAVVEARLRQTFGLDADASVSTLAARQARVLTDAERTDLIAVLSGGPKTFKEFATHLIAADAASNDKDRAAALGRYLLTGTGTARDKLLSADMKRDRPDLDATTLGAQQRFLKLSAALTALKLVEASAALDTIAQSVRNHYEAAKATVGALDFDDLIWRTRELLSGSNTAEWVLFKLDGGLDHVLVDEAQDTSPEQWEIVAALASEFFSPGGSKKDVRSVFAVGDLKQSIYSFQGAAPEMFAAMRERFAAMAVNAGLEVRPVPLTLSFRTVEPVLRAVDTVFATTPLADAASAATVSVTHDVRRDGQAGHVELWPVISADASAPSDPFDPLADSTSKAPVNQLADRIADTIQRWIDSKEQLPSQNRAITPGDVLILVRKRHPFLMPMVAALKARGIAVAGTDRMVLIEQIAAQDLAVLGDFLTLPEDDLALATVLKSPLFGMTDDDLLAFAPNRKGALWKAFLEAARSNPAWQPAAETLRRWRAKADFLPPYEFFCHVLDAGGGRERMLQRLGPEAADVLDEFLETALTYDDAHPPSLAGFLAHLRRDQREVKRDMNTMRDEVRVMTVHAAKGLEAPIVFLPDTCSATSGDSKSAKLHELENDPQLPPVWQIKGSSKHPVLQDSTARQKQADDLERNRLLYVAMTRARDRLYVAGFEGEKTRAANCWYNIIDTALKPLMTEQTDAPLGERWVLSTPQRDEPENRGEQRKLSAPARERPTFATKRIEAEPQLSVPLAPSRLEPYTPDDDGEPSTTAAPDPALANDVPSPSRIATASGGDRFLRGTLTHALLQHLPNLAPSERQATADAFLKNRGKALKPATRKSIAAEVMAILNDAAFAPLFGPQSRAEAAISADLPRPKRANVRPGPALRLSGQIDRIAILADRVLIVDYKTNRPPPVEVSNVADAYVLQLAAYVLALREIYPEKRVEAALLWTYTPQLMPLPETVIEAAIMRLWNLDLGDLDAA